MSEYKQYPIAKSFQFTQPQHGQIGVEIELLTTSQAKDGPQFVRFSLPIEAMAGLVEALQKAARQAPANDLSKAH